MNELTSWVAVPADSDFPIQNLPFGIFSTSERTKRVGVAIGDQILDLKALHMLGYLENLPFTLADFEAPVLNPMIARGKQATRELRNRLVKLLDATRPDLRDKEHHVGQILVPQSEAAMHLPVEIGDYKTDRITRQPYRELREVQQAVARAEAQLGAARAYVYQSLDAQWARLERGEPLSVKERADTFLARQNAFQTGRAVVQLMYDTIGGAAVYSSNPFDRPLRDMMTACQHIVAQEKTLASVGSLLLGADEDRGML